VFSTGFFAQIFRARIACGGRLRRGTRSGVRASAQAVSRERAAIAVICGEDRFVLAAREAVQRKIASTKICAGLTRVRNPDTVAGHNEGPRAHATRAGAGHCASPTIRAGAGHSALRYRPLSPRSALIRAGAGHSALRYRPLSPRSALTRAGAGHSASRTNPAPRTLNPPTRSHRASASGVNSLAFKPRLIRTARNSRSVARPVRRFSTRMTSGRNTPFFTSRYFFTLTRLTDRPA